METSYQQKCLIGGCGATRPNSEELYVHRYHEHPQLFDKDGDSKKFVCGRKTAISGTVCPASFTSRTKLNGHLRKIHGLSGGHDAEQLECVREDCPHVCYSRAQLANHLSECHEYEGIKEHQFEGATAWQQVRHYLDVLLEKYNEYYVNERMVRSNRQCMKYYSNLNRCMFHTIFRPLQVDKDGKLFVYFNCHQRDNRNPDVLHSQKKIGKCPAFVALHAVKDADSTTPEDANEIATLFPNAENKEKILRYG